MSVTSVNNALPLPPPPGNPFDDIMDAYFSGFDSPTYAATAAGKKQAIWLSFLQASNLTSVITNPQNQAEIDEQSKQAKAFLDFVRRTDIDVFQPIPPAAGQYGIGSIMDSIFGTLSAGKQQTIWVKFLNFVPTVPPYTQQVLDDYTNLYPNGLLAAYNSNSLVDDDATQQLFLSFIQQSIANNDITIVSYTNKVLTPEEIKKRNIMFEVFNSVIDMLLSLQNTVTKQADNLAFYARWQREYTAMLTRVPTYVGGESSVVKIDITDLNSPNPDYSKMTFGYNDISVEDIAKWWAQERLDGGTETFDIKSFTLRDANGNTQYLRLSFGPGGIGLSITFQGTNFGSTIGLGGSSVPVGTTFDESVKNFENAFKSVWLGSGDSIVTGNSTASTNYLNTLTTGAGTIAPGTTNPIAQATLIQASIFAPTALPLGSKSLFAILKPYTYVGPSNLTDPANAVRALSDANAKSRGEINARAQQYIENVRSKRQVVQDIQSEQQANLDQSRQTLTQQSDLLTSIIDSLKGLLSSIFR